MTKGGPGAPDARRPPLPPLPAGPAAATKTPDPAASLPSAGGELGSRAPGAALPGCKGLSGPVSPKFMVWFLSRAHDGGSAETRVKTSQTHEEKTPNSDRAASASLSSVPRESLKADARDPNPYESSSWRRPSASAAHTSSAAEAGRRRRAAGGAPGPRPPAASGPLLRRAGRPGTAGTRAASRVGRRAGEAERSGPSRGRGARS